jgi:hypothetical protein
MAKMTRPLLSAATRALRAAALLAIPTLISAWTIAPPAAAAGTPMQLVSIVRPAASQLVSSRAVRLVIATRRGARPTHVNINGVSVTRRLRRGKKGVYTAKLSLGHGVHYGINDAFVRTKGSNPRTRFDHTRFIVTKRNKALLRLTTIRVGTKDAPVRLTLNRSRGASARAYVNGNRVDRAFASRDKLLVGRLGANDGLHYGRNRIKVVVHRTDGYRHRSSYDVESRTVRISRRTPLASAGGDETGTATDFTMLNGGASKVPKGSAQRSFYWKLVSRPKGSKTRLRHVTARRPLIRPDRPGYYRVRVAVRGKGRTVSRDTMRLAAQADLKPVGVRLDTMLNKFAEPAINGSVVEGTYNAVPRREIRYVIFDRTTLGPPVAKGRVGNDAAGIAQLRAKVDVDRTTQNYLVVLNWIHFPDGAAIDAFDALLQAIGAEKMDATQRAMGLGENDAPGSAVGVPGSPAGSAFASFPSRTIRQQAECGQYWFNNCDLWPTLANMVGSVRKNGVTGKFDFIPNDVVEFDTAPNQTAAQTAPAQLAIKVGDHTLAQPRPGEPGAAGFQLVRVDARSLTELGNYAYRTNTAAGDSVQAEEQRLARDLKAIADRPEAPELVFLQAFGAPHGDDPDWDAAAQQVERLGGTRQIFNAMNAPGPRSENGEQPSGKGPYALVGRTGSGAPRAEASYSNDGLPGRLRGVLMRGHDGTLSPMLAAPATRSGGTTVNTELMKITNQASTTWPEFKATGGASISSAHLQAVQNFLGGPTVTKLCSGSVPDCDIRDAYYQSYNADWAGIQDKLGSYSEKKCLEAHSGFTPPECEGVRAQLYEEVSDVAQVTRYFGKDGLQRPFGAAGVTALADVTQISNSIVTAVNPPAGSNATSNALTGISYFLKLGGFIPPPGNLVAAGISGAFAIGGYYTRADGTPSLIGPKVTAGAASLGVELAKRYGQAGDNLDNIGRLIVSDHGKLTAVAGKVNAAPASGEMDWRLEGLAQTRPDLERATKQTIYERLVPLAFPVIYDLGESGNARSWYCHSGSVLVDKNLFADEPDSAQLVGRFPGVHPSRPDLAFPYAPNMAVGAEHARGSARSARIPGPSADVTDPLFKTRGEGGVGLTKLEFYSARNGFRYYPTEPSRYPDFSKGQGSLNMFPRGRPDVLGCEQIRDPPGNSG